jgi:ABC-type multidrug transport system fused ATPase/permease subunit
MLLMLVGTFAEAVSIGAVLPFLLVLVDPARLHSLPVLGSWVQAISPGTDLAAVATALFFSLLLISAALRLWLAWVSQGFALNASLDLAQIAYHRLIRQPYPFYVREHSAEIIGRFDLIYQVTHTVLVNGVQALIATVLAIMLMIVLLLVDAVVATGAALTLIGIYLLTSLAVRRTLARNSGVLESRWGLRVRHVQEALGGIRDILLDRTQPVFERAYRDNAEALNHALRVNTFAANAPRIVVEVVGVVMIAGLALHLSGTPGGLVGAIPTLGAIALAGQRLIPLLQQAYGGWTNWRGNGAALNSVAAFISLPVEQLPEESAGTEQDARFAGLIRFEDVGFSYTDGAPVLHGLSFVVRRGERVGIVGPTGAGKSTLIDLLLGLLEPSSGEIRVDDVPLDWSRRGWWQRQIAHVPQAIYLSDDTIAANIAFGVPAAEIDESRVEQAARDARLHDFIATLPEGYATMCGERGARLSGGQRQRIGIARALYKRASVLLFDEATSALDDETERAVLAAVADLPPEITVITVAHRLSTLACCDRILCLESGRIQREVRSVADLELLPREER